MSTPTLPREPEGLRPRSIWLVGAATVALVLALTAIAWLLVKPPGASRGATTASSLEHGLFDAAHGRAGARAPDRYQWIDRDAGIARIPIAQAIDAVVANPTLIGAPAGGAP